MSNKSVPLAIEKLAQDLLTEEEIQTLCEQLELEYHPYLAMKDIILFIFSNQQSTLQSIKRYGTLFVKKESSPNSVFVEKFEKMNFTEQQYLITKKLCITDIIPVEVYIFIFSFLKSDGKFLMLMRLINKWHSAQRVFWSGQGFLFRSLNFYTL